MTKEDITPQQLKKLKDSYKFLKSSTKHRVDRNKDPIGWEFTFDTWLQVWLDSGKLHLRGTYKGGYVMARKNDIGPYSIDNVDIILHSDNTKFAKSYWGGPSEEVKAHIKYMRQFQTITEEAKQKMSASQKKRWENIDKTTLNWKHTPEQLEKMRNAKLGKKQPIAICPHCNKEGGAANLKRYHFDNCKFK
jgi:hypothetical protein